MCIYVEFHDSQYDELSLKTNPGCLDRLLTSNTCIGNLRLCLKNHGFLFAFDQELWLQSNPEAFLHSECCSGEKSDAAEAESSQDSRCQLLWYAEINTEFLRLVQ